MIEHKTETATSDRDLEAETILRWDRTCDVALLYTADPAEMRRWQKLGYDVQVYGRRRGRPSGWQAHVPVVAVALLPIRDGQVKVPRWLEPPTVRDVAINAQGRRDPEKPDQKTEEIRTDFPAGDQTARLRAIGQAFRFPARPTA
jgi:hypothetical protein